MLIAAPGVSRLASAASRDNLGFLLLKFLHALRELLARPRTMSVTSCAVFHRFLIAAIVASACRSRVLGSHHATGVALALLLRLARERVGAAALEHAAMLHEVHDVGRRERLEAVRDLHDGEAEGGGAARRRDVARRALLRQTCGVERRT